MAPTATLTEVPPAKSLVFVQVVFRHGNRTPATSFATDKHKHNLFRPYGQGQLTNEGKRQAFELGKTLRGLYGSLLGDEYDPEVLYSASSGLPRAEMTLQCVHAGLFPICEQKQLEIGLSWQPVLYDLFSKDGDKYLAIHVYDNSLLDVYKTIDEEKQKIYDYVSLHSGQKIQNAHHFFKVQNAIQVQEEIGLEAPDWAKAVPKEVMLDLTLDLWEEVATERVCEIAGNLVKLLTDNLISKVNGNKNKDRRMCLFSGHDVNIVGLLGAFNSFKREYIEYCSFIALELHFINNEYFVKVIYQNGLDGSKRQPLKLFPSMKDDCLCKVDDFVSGTKWLYTSES